ncbi:MAG TPA: transglycosylase SLT domain-containing protein [Desulfuromonadales bacterium]|nr:transglycosylase SLT domain-containing protein [Desulfuromonadales bacterium]
MTASNSHPDFIGSTIVAAVLKGNASPEEKRLSAPFTIGRADGCELQISETSVSRRHASLEPTVDGWLLKDLGSGNCTFLDGVRITEMLLTDRCSIELGIGGPVISLRIEKFEEPVRETVRVLHSSAPEKISEVTGPQPPQKTDSQKLHRYFSDNAPEDASEQTMMFRQAFKQAHKKKSKKYLWLIGVAVLLLAVSGGVILFQQNKLDAMRATAQNIFYMMKEQEVQIGKLEEIALLTTNPAQMAELKAKRNKSKGMEKEYDSFVKELGIYAKLSDEDRIIMRIARVFGECELSMPKDFVAEVKRYIAIWKSTDRLQTALKRAEEKGYTPLIIQLLKDNNLPYQYFFLAMQESNFDDRAVGPLTRYGHAKGMWQFISLTANDYGLRIGPMFEKPVYDPFDERFDYRKATVAAARYLKDLNNSDAQASGLLAMASYNWGDGNVRKMIGRMPENPRERNFWKLLAQKNIPKETYDYVFLIFSAAVICENPKLFGADVVCPNFPLPTGQVQPVSSGMVNN